MNPAERVRRGDSDAWIIVGEALPERFDQLQRAFSPKLLQGGHAGARLARLELHEHPPLHSTIPLEPKRRNVSKSQANASRPIFPGRSARLEPCWMSLLSPG